MPVTRIPHQAYGVAFLVLGTAAWILGLFVVFSFTVGWGLADLGLIIGSFVAIISVYCTKCPSRKKCCHVVPGMMTTYFPKRKSEPYKPWETIMAFGSIIAMTIFPLYWLWQRPGMLFVFAGLFTAAVVVLRMRVCGGCHNVFCILKPKTCMVV